MTRTFTARLTIAGQPIDFRLRSVAHECALNGHARVRVHLSSVQRGALDRERVHGWVGCEFELVLERSDAGAIQTSEPIRGYVRMVDGDGDAVLLAGASFETRMDVIPRTRSFADRSSVELAQDLAGAAHVALDISKAGEPAKREFGAQRDESDFAFLMRAAARDGLLVYDRGGTWHWRESIDSARPLRIGALELCERPRVRIEPTPFRVRALRWPVDPADRVVADSSEFQPAAGGIAGAAADAEQRSFGGAVGDASHAPSDEAGALSKFLGHRARAAATAAALVEFATDRVDVAVGDAVQVDGVDHAGEGEVLAVVAVRREFSDRGHYRCQVTAAPIEHAGAGLAPAQRTWSGLAEAVVVDTEDPSALGRVHVRFAWDDQAVVLARVAVAAAGPRYGCVWTPRVGSRVLVAFVDGDAERPVIVGCAYDADAAPQFQTPNGASEALLVRTEAGTELRVVESEDGDQITLGKAGRALLSLLVSDSAQVTIESSGAITVKAATVSVDAEQKLTLKAPEVSIEADTLRLAGGDTRVTAQGTLQLDGARVEIAP